MFNSLSAKKMTFVSFLPGLHAKALNCMQKWDLRKKAAKKWVRSRVFFVKEGSGSSQNGSPRLFLTVPNHNYYKWLKMETTNVNLKKLLCNVNGFLRFGTPRGSSKFWGDKIKAAWPLNICFSGCVMRNNDPFKYDSYTLSFSNIDWSLNRISSTESRIWTVTFNECFLWLFKND